MPRAVEPRPLPQHTLKTVLLRVPSAVWPLVSTGKISEFRAAGGNAPQLWKVPLPTAVVAFRRRLSCTDYDYRLMLLQAVRREALGTISDAGLAAAGYEGDGAFARFRRDWVIAEKRRFDPLRTVFVYRVRPIESSDYADVGSALIDHLFGDYLAQDAHLRTRTVQC